MLSLKVPFTFEDGEVTTVSNVDTIVKQDIVSYFMTSNGERVMNGVFGGNLSALVFEINDPLVLADYKVDTFPNVNSNLRFGNVLDMFILNTNAQQASYEDNVLPIAIQYAVSPRTISTIRLNVNVPYFTEESSI